MKRKKNFMVSCFLVTSLLVFGQETPVVQTVTIDEAVTLAIDNNIALSSSSIDVRMKKRDANYAWNVFIPSVQATGTIARSNNASNPYGAIIKMLNPLYIEPAVTETDHWNAMAGLTLSLNLNAALFEGLKATRQNYEAGQLTFEQARQKTEKDVRKAFYGILLQEGSLALAKDKFAASENRLRQTEANFKNGLVPELAYLQTQLASEMQKPVIMEAELGLEQQKNMFAFLIGLPVGTKIILNGKIDPTIITVNAKEAIDTNLANRLDLAILQKNIDMLQTQIRAVQLQRYTPSIALSQSFSPRLSAFDADWMNGNNWTDSSGAFSVTLAFNLTNMLPFSTSGQSLSNTKDNLAKLEKAKMLAMYNAELEIQNLVKKLDKSKTAISTMELSVTIAEKAFRLSEQGYRAGTIEYLDLKDAENSLLQARLGVLSEKFTYISNMLDLETALNTKFN